MPHTRPHGARQILRQSRSWAAQPPMLIEVSVPGIRKERGKLPAPTGGPLAGPATPGPLPDGGRGVRAGWQPARKPLSNAIAALRPPIAATVPTRVFLAIASPVDQVYRVPAAGASAPTRPIGGAAVKGVGECQDWSRHRRLLGRTRHRPLPLWSGKGGGAAFARLPKACRAKRTRFPHSGRRILPV
jgi:hypothetical protein